MQAADEDEDLDGVPLAAPASLPAVALSAALHAGYAVAPPAPPQPVVAADKLLLFSAGQAVSTVSRVEAARAAEEERRRRAESEAAAVYVEFIAAFNSEREAGTGRDAAAAAGADKKRPDAGFTRFVKGGVIGGAAGERSGSASSLLSAPLPEQTQGSSALAAEPPPPLPAPPPASPSPSLQPGPSRPVRHIDLFLEELKAQQGDGQASLAAAAEQAAGPSQPAALASSAAALTTNLYLCNLPLSVSCAALVSRFSVYGDIASVKLLWPRGEEEAQRQRGTRNGFVAFMQRRDAEEALRECHGSHWMGQTLRINWAKAIPLPSLPMARKATAGASGSGVAAAAAAAGAATPLAAPQRLFVSFPSSAAVKATIDQLAWEVSQCGYELEQAIIEREAAAAAAAAAVGASASSPSPFSFLFQFDSADNRYYRWKLYSLTHGGSLRSWSTAAVSLTPGGPLWLPPSDDRNVRSGEQEAEAEAAVASHGAQPADSGQWREEQRLAAERRMSSADAAVLSSLLCPPALSLSRSSILRVMGFCLEHAAAAAFVLESLCSRVVSASCASQRLSLLYLLSDLLFNSSAPVAFASQYRREVDRTADAGAVSRAMDSWGRTEGASGVGSAERRRVLAVLRLWQSWSLFPDEQIARWEARVTARTATSAAAAAAATAGGAETEDELNGRPLSATDSRPANTAAA